MPLYYVCFSLCKKCTFTVTYPFCKRLVIMRTYQYKLRKMYHMNMAQRKSFLLLKRRCIVFSNFSVETRNLRLFFKVLRIFSLEKNATNLLQILIQYMVCCIAQNERASVYKKCNIFLLGQFKSYIIKFSEPAIRHDVYIK